MPQPVVPSILQPPGPPMPLTSIMISPLKLVITSNLRSISPTFTPNLPIIEDTRGTAEQTLLDIQRIVPIEPTLIDDHDIPDAMHSTYSVLEAVALDGSTFEPHASIHAQPTPMDVTVCSSTDSPGTQRRAFVNEEFIFLCRRESSNERPKSADSFHRCRSTSHGIFTS